MTVGRLNLTVFSSALFCFGTICATSSQAVPQRPWYLAAFDHVFRAVHSDSAQVSLAEKNTDQGYVSRITKDESTITLKGDVPSGGDLKILQGVAAATSPGATFVDKTKVNASVPDHDNWLAAMTFALRQLGKLEHGAAFLRNSSIVIEGVTKSGDDFASVQKKLRDEAPKGVDLRAAVKPHDVRPFVWLAQLQPGTLNLSGYVPDRQDRALCSYAQNLFQNVKVNNGMEFAKGEPGDWLAAARAALDILSLLHAGNASISDNVIKIDGVYSSANVHELIKAYAQKVPPSFKLETNLVESMTKLPAARAGDLSLAAHSGPAPLNP